MEIFKRVLTDRNIAMDQASLSHVLNKYAAEGRMMKSCEPRDLLNRLTDVCLFEGQPPRLTPELIDIAWKNYFGIAHGFQSDSEVADDETRSVAA
jgi:hypothetical protein